MGSMIFDNTNSSNPIAAIEEVHDAFRTKIRQNVANYVIKYKWIKKYDMEKALEEYLLATTENKTIDNWRKLLQKMENEVKNEFANLCDEWMLKRLSIFNLTSEIRQAFTQEWDQLGPRPDGLL